MTNRRDFLRQSLLATAGLTLGACATDRGADELATDAATTGAAPAGSPTPSVATPTATADPLAFDVQTLSGRGVIPFDVIAQHGLDKKYAVEPTLTTPANPQAMATALQSGETDLMINGWTFPTRMTAQGEHVVNVFPVNTFMYDVLVPEDSPIEDFSGLKGKKVGAFGGPSGATTALFLMECITLFGFDPRTEATMQYGAPPLMAELMLNGELDAALLLDPLIVKVMSNNAVRSVGEVGSIWKEATGDTLVVTTLAASASYLQENPDGVTRFIQALTESYDLIQGDTVDWSSLAKTHFDIEGEEAVQAIRERTAPTFTSEWNDEVVQAHIDFGRQAIEVLGEDFLPGVPEESFSTAYLPA